MKNLKLFGMALVMGIASLLLVPSVDAATIEVVNGDDLSAKVASALDGDVLNIANGTYNGDITISKNITLKGESKTGTIINGGVVVDTADLVVTLDTLTVENAGTIIDVKAKSNLTVKNAKVIYNGYVDTYATNAADGIWLEKTANGSTLTVENSDVVAKYAIWVYGEGNTVDIKNSNIIGWAALDISNGTSSTTQATGNAITVTGSTLKGINDYTGASNSYGTIVIGGQKGLQLLITDSTVTNGVNTEQAQDLIVYGDAYRTSSECVVVITNSTLTNTALLGNPSAVYNIGTEDNVLGLNVFGVENTEITATNNVIYPTMTDYVYLTVDAMGSKAVTLIPTGSVLGSLEDPEAVEGYTFKGYFTDNTFKTKFDFTKAIDTDTTIYALYEEVKDNSEKNPETSDNIMIFIAVGATSILGIAGMAIYLNKKKANA